LKFWPDWTHSKINAAGGINSLQRKGFAYVC
jgi:hypothetical protein